MSLIEGNNSPSPSVVGTEVLMVGTGHFRFRLITSFGKETIRRFANNASQMKGLAARNFEDLLQVRQVTHFR